MDTFYIDVRENDEFEAQHIEGALNTPLSTFEKFIAPISQLAKTFKIVLVCKSGVRSTNALNLLKKKNNSLPEINILDGGIDKWTQDGKDLVCKTGKKSLPIMRQVMIVAGFLVLFGSLGALFLKAEMIWLSVFVGTGLSFAGLSGICFMAKILAVMPWNK